MGKSPSFPVEVEQLAKDDGRIGKLIRQRRHEKKISLKELGVKSGLSIGLLSQIERGISSPTVRTLRLIGNALDVSTFWFFEKTTKNSREAEIIVRVGARTAINFAKGIRKELLTAPTPAGIELLDVVMEPGASSGEFFYTHPGEEAGSVIAGTMTLYVEDEVFVLREGDSFRFKSTLPHRFENPGSVEARIMWALIEPVFV